MGAFKTIFGKWKNKNQLNAYFKMLDGYVPVFTSYDGGVYEMELTRSCIHSFASHASKLLPCVQGADLRRYAELLNTKPNPFMTSSQFLYKVATIYEVQNTVYIVPILDSFGRTVGFYPILPSQTEILEVDGIPWLRYTFKDGSKAAIEMERVGIVSKYLYTKDFIGESNQALRHTLQLIHTQNEGIEEGIKNNASFRFMANVNNFAKTEDLKKEREKFVKENFGVGSGGLALFPNTYTNVQQIKSNPEIVNPEQMKIIQERVYEYFGTNEDILQNKAFGDAWSAYYEGKIEPFALQLSQALTCMAYSAGELARDNSIVFTANRLQYMTNKDKLEVSAQLFDRGIMSLNMIMDIWNMPHVEGGDQRYIRKEYTEIEKLNESNLILTENGGSENDTVGKNEIQNGSPEPDDVG